MTTKNPVYLSLALFFSLNPSWAATEGSWQCIVKDDTSKEWVGESDYRRAAVNHAFEACKKESRLPETCKTITENCNSSVNELSTRPMWRCFALDHMAKYWESNPYPQRDDAALAAKAYCQNRSKFPDSCYINLLTCKNINLKD